MYFSFFFFFNDTATTEIYTLSLHDALPIFVADPDADGAAHALGVDGQRQPIVGERDEDRGLLELHRERQAVELPREPRIEVQDAFADVGARVTALHEVECPAHDTHVDALLRRAALDVVDIALERDKEPV